MRNGLIVFVLIMTLPFLKYAQQGSASNLIPEDFCVTADEVHLYRLINEYRQVFGLEIILMSKSLSYVAHVHVRDLYRNRPDLFSCNLHSWSDKGIWTACCYSKDPNRTNCMWNKPRELTGYMGNGQELILWENIPATPRSTFNQWKSFEPTNDLLLNRERWSDKTWMAMGIAIYRGYASAWFGEVVDPENLISHCDAEAELSSDWLINEVAQKQKVDTEPEIEIQVSTYYLIVSSFKERSLAESEVRRLQSGGYIDAKMIEKDENFRVSVYDYTDLDEAQKMRRQLSAVFKGIWIKEH